MDGFVTDVADFRPVDGLCLEAWGGGTKNINNKCWNQDPIPANWSTQFFTPQQWQLNVERIMEAPQAKVHAFPTIGQAGCKAAAVEAVPQPDQWEALVYASFLMAVESSDPEHGPHLGIAGYYFEGPAGKRRPLVRQGPPAVQLGHRQAN